VTGLAAAFVQAHSARIEVEPHALERELVTDAAEFTATMHVSRPDEAMRARPAGITLEVLSGADAGKTFRFELGTGQRRTDVLVGGRSLADITLTDSSVSQRHFELQFATGKTAPGRPRSRWVGASPVYVYASTSHTCELPLPDGCLQP
jgi:hypothetical protein